MPIPSVPTVHRSRRWPVLAILLALGAPAAADTPRGTAAAPPATACDADNAGLSLPPGFCATLYADSLGHARHLAVAADGTVYVNTWSGEYYPRSPAPSGGFIVALHDSTGSGHADSVQRFGPGPAQGATGGTGIAIYAGGLYVEQGNRIVRYALRPGQRVPTGKPAVVVDRLPLSGDHPMHPFVIDAEGHLYVDLGSASNACETPSRMPHSPGARPCAELATRAGIWRYDARRTGQHFSPKERYATGIRNGEGLAFDAAGRLYATQHGRDQLGENWQPLYTPEQGHELPAEVVVEVVRGGDYGWPECYYDGVQQKLVLAPEYGGDGGHAVGSCADKRGPVAAFPAHWAPNDLLVYAGGQFPAPYRGGAFIAFHGSWNRAPALQAGYNVAFQSLRDGRATGDYIVFADGFAGPEKAPGRARFRPSGLALLPDGALLVSDDKQGRIWRIAYHGDPGLSVLTPASVPTTDGHAVDGRPPLATLPLAPGATPAQLARGEQVYQGAAAGGTCSGCHASDARGSSVGPDLTRGDWQWGDGSVEAIAATIRAGVSAPKKVRGAMPPRGGAALTDDDVAAAAVYVWGVAHRAH